MIKYLIPFFLLPGFPQLAWAEESDQTPSSKPVIRPIWTFEET